MNWWVIGVIIMLLLARGCVTWFLKTTAINEHLKEISTDLKRINQGIAEYANNHRS